MSGGTAWLAGREAHGPNHPSPPPFRKRHLSRCLGRSGRKHGVKKGELADELDEHEREAEVLMFCPDAPSVNGSFGWERTD
jgi:hypothetical protein